MPASARTPVYGLDIVRLLAALAVVLYHFGFNAFAVESNPIRRLMGEPAHLPGWWDWTWFGWIGVQVFFVISGLVIAYSVEGSTAASFARKRTLRLVPVVWISAAIALPVALFAYDFAPAKALAQFARTLVFFPVGPWLMGQFWTLPIEVAFYGLVWLLILMRRGGALEPLAWALAAAAALYVWLIHGRGIADPAPRLTALLLLQHGQYFALGILGARVDTHGYRPRHMVLAAACLFLAAVEIQSVALADPHLRPLAHRWLVPYGLWLGAMVTIWASFHWKEAIARVARPLARPIRHLGLVTFPIYTLHIHAGGPVLALLRAAGLPPFAAIAIAASAAILAASAVVLWLEPPMRRALERVLSLRLPRATRIAAAE